MLQPRKPSAPGLLRAVPGDSIPLPLWAVGGDGSFLMCLSGIGGHSRHRCLCFSIRGMRFSPFSNGSGPGSCHSHAASMTRARWLRIQVPRGCAASSVQAPLSSLLPASLFPPFLPLFLLPPGLTPFLSSLPSLSLCYCGSGALTLCWSSSVGCAGKAASS